MNMKKKNCGKRPCPFEEYDRECQQVCGEAKCKQTAENPNVDWGVPSQQLLILQVGLQHLQVAGVLFYLIFLSIFLPPSTQCTLLLLLLLLLFTSRYPVYFLLTFYFHFLPPGSRCTFFLFLLLLLFTSR